MKIKVSGATNLHLNWLVAQCLGHTPDSYLNSAIVVKDVKGKATGIQIPGIRDYVWFAPATNWAQGGPIIEQNGLELSVHVIHNGVITSWASEKDWPSTTEKSACGPTPLVAAMRCFVVSHLGNEVEIPEELK